MALDGETVAVNVSDCPKSTGLADVESVLLVCAPKDPSTSTNNIAGARPKRPIFLNPPMPNRLYDRVKNTF